MLLWGDSRVEWVPGGWLVPRGVFEDRHLNFVSFSIFSQSESGMDKNFANSCIEQPKAKWRIINCEERYTGVYWRDMDKMDLFQTQQDCCTSHQLLTVQYDIFHSVITLLIIQDALPQRFPCNCFVVLHHHFCIMHHSWVLAGTYISTNCFGHGWLAHHELHTMEITVCIALQHSLVHSALVRSEFIQFRWYACSVYINENKSIIKHYCVADWGVRVGE